MEKTCGNFSFPALIERDGDYLVISFRDVPEALGQIAVADESTLPEEARETVMIALRYYFKEGRAIPAASAPREGEKIIELPLSFVAKIILHNTMLKNDVRPVTLARLLSIPRSEVARITSPAFKTKIDTMAAAVAASGGVMRLVAA